LGENTTCSLQTALKITALGLKRNIVEITVILQPCLLCFG